MLKIQQVLLALCLSDKKIVDKVEKQLQRYVNDALQQGVDLDTLSPEQLKMIVQHE